jgi:asparagine synthase (glutamine-hydrolysing)
MEAAHDLAMCGIVGTAARDAAPIPLEQMSAALRHRGPDDHGLWRSADRSVGLAHQRLAILDLTEGGRQPMADVSGSLHIAFNGEIYNFAELRQELKQKGHSFRSRSDTEVVLAAYAEWGSEFVERLNGMFAFALYDGRTRKLLLARDRAGEKPLYYRHDRGRVYLRFGTEGPDRGSRVHP